MKGLLFVTLHGRAVVIPPARWTHNWRAYPDLYPVTWVDETLKRTGLTIPPGWRPLRYDETPRADDRIMYFDGGWDWHVYARVKDSCTPHGTKFIRRL